MSISYGPEIRAGTERRFSSICPTFILLQAPINGATRDYARRTGLSVIDWPHPAPRRSLGGRTLALGEAPPCRKVDTDAQLPGPVPTAPLPSDRGQGVYRRRPLICQRRRSIQPT